MGVDALCFSIDADLHQVIEATVSRSVPCSGLSLYNHLKQLGKLFDMLRKDGYDGFSLCVDHVWQSSLKYNQILKFSSSLEPIGKWSEGCKAVESLLYPVKHWLEFYWEFSFLEKMFLF